MGAASGKIAIVTFYSLTTVSSLFCGYIIVKYHQNKPLGMQTLLSKVIILFIWVFSQASICATIIRALTEFFVPISKIMAYMATIYNFVSAISFLFSIFVMLVTKYVSVFHIALVASFDEDKVLPFLWITTLGVPVILAILQYRILSSVEVGSMFQLLTGSKEEVITNDVSLFTIVFVITAITMFFVFVRIEVDYHEYGYLSKVKNFLRGTRVGPSPQPRIEIVGNQAAVKINDSPGYTKNAIRFFALISAVFVFVILFVNESGRFMFLFMRMFFSVICPAFFIWNHLGIRSTLKHQVRVILHQ